MFLSHVVSARRGSFVHLRHGPILSPRAPESVWQEIAEFTKEVARKNNCWFVRMSPQLPVGDQSDTIRKIFMAFQHLFIVWMGNMFGFWISIFQKKSFYQICAKSPVMRYEERKKKGLKY